MAKTIKLNIAPKAATTLRHQKTKQAFNVGDTVTDRDGETLTITSWHEGRTEASSGRVYVRTADGFEHGYYPHVFDLEVVATKAAR